MLLLISRNGVVDLRSAIPPFDETTVQSVRTEYTGNSKYFSFQFSVKLDNCRASDNRSTRGSSERWAELCRRGTTSLHAEHVDDPIPESARGFLPRCSRTARSLCDTSAKDAVVPRSHKTANLYRRVPHTKRLAERHRAIVPSNTFRPRVRRSDVQCRKYSDEESARRCGGFRLHYLHI